MNIEHVAVYTRNLEDLRDFYCRYFNASCGSRYLSKSGMQSYFLTFESGARLELMWFPDLGDGPVEACCVGLTHLAFSAGSRQSVDALTRRLTEDGFRLLSAPRTTGDGYYESCIADPDGNRVEITV